MYLNKRRWLCFWFLFPQDIFVLLFVNYPQLGYQNDKLSNASPAQEDPTIVRMVHQRSADVFIKKTAICLSIVYCIRQDYTNLELAYPTYIYTIFFSQRNMGVRVEPLFLLVNSDIWVTIIKEIILQAVAKNITPITNIDTCSPVRDSFGLYSTLTHTSQASPITYCCPSTQ